MNGDDNRIGIWIASVILTVLILAVLASAWVMLP